MLPKIPLTEGVLVRPRHPGIRDPQPNDPRGGSCRRRGRGQDGFSRGFFGSVGRATPVDLVVTCTGVVTDEGAG